MRHELIINGNGGAMIRRTREDGQRKVWCGRDMGWREWHGWGEGYAPRAKVYSTRMNARKALRRILAHERELGLAGMDYERTSWLA